MKEKSDVGFEALLRSLVLSPEETLRCDALREKMRARVGRAFEVSTSRGNLFEIPSSRNLPMCDEKAK
jgi:hypothetical protein